MTTYYVDYEGGVDSAAGTSFANRKKTINATLAIASAGDIIRVMSSDGPKSVANAVWTNGSNVIVCDTTIGMLIDWANTAWTSGNSSVHGTTTRHWKLGNASVWCDVADGDGFGRLIYKNLPATLDLSAFEQISVWCYNDVDFPDLANLKIGLCTDNVGNTPVHFVDCFFRGQQTTISESLMGLNVQDNGSPLSTSINSVALFKTGTASGNLSFNHIVATKNSASNVGITMRNILHHNKDNIHTYYAIRGFNAANIFIEQPWHGDTATYLTNAWSTTMTANHAGAGSGFETGINVQAMPARSTTLVNPISILGGWDRTDMSTRTGYTIYDPHGFGATGFDLNQGGGLVFDKIGICRINYGVLANNCSNVFWNNSFISSAHFNPVYIANANNFFLCNSIIHTHDTEAIQIDGGTRRLVIDNAVIQGPTNGITSFETNGIQNEFLVLSNTKFFVCAPAILLRGFDTIKLNNVTVARDLSTVGCIRLHDDADIEINNLTVNNTLGNGVCFTDVIGVRGTNWKITNAAKYAISANNGQGHGHIYVDGLYVANCVSGFMAASNYSGAYHFSNARIYNVNQNTIVALNPKKLPDVYFDRFCNTSNVTGVESANMHMKFMTGGTIFANTDANVNYRYAWHAKIGPTLGDTSDLRPLRLKVADVYAVAYSPVHIKAAIKKSGATVFSRLIVPQQFGLETENSVFSASTGQYEEVSMNFLPSEDSAYEVYWETWGTPDGWATLDNVYIPWQAAPAANYSPTANGDGIVFFYDNYTIDQEGATGNRYSVRTKDPLKRSPNSYWEFYVGDRGSSGAETYVGVATKTFPRQGLKLGTDNRGAGRTALDWIYNNQTILSPETYFDSETLRFAVNTDRQIWLGLIDAAVNGVKWESSGDPTAGTGNNWIIPGGQQWYPAVSMHDSGAFGRWYTGRYGLWARPPVGYEPLENLTSEYLQWWRAEGFGSPLAISNANLFLGVTSTAAGGFTQISNRPALSNIYFEIKLHTFPTTATNRGENAWGLGWLWKKQDMNQQPGTDGGAVAIEGDGDVRVYNNTVANYGEFVAGDVVGIAYEWISGKFYVAKNNTWFNSANPTIGTGNVAIALNTEKYYYFPMCGIYHTQTSYTLRPNATTWEYGPPANFGATESVVVDNYPRHVLDTTASHLGYAYGLRRLRASYTGSPIRLKDAGASNREQDIPFLANGALDAANAATFLGGNVGLVAKWYDQSSFNRDLIASNTIAYPIYQATGFQGKPSIQFVRSGTNTGNTFNTLTTANLNTNITCFVALRPDTNSTRYTILGKGINTAGGAGELSYYLDSSGIPLVDRPVTETGLNSGGSAVGTSNVLIGVQISSTSVTHYKNGSTNGTDTLATATGTGTDMWVGMYNNGDLEHPLAGNVVELVLTAAAVSSADIDRLRNNVNAYYSIY